MKTQHTPGPWKIVRYSNYTGFSVWAGDRGCIAERWYDKEQDQPYGAEVDSNARLIAAAPDQYAELIQVEKLLSDYVSGEHAVEMCAFAERLHAVQSAISKVVDSPS